MGRVTVFCFNSYMVQLKYKVLTVSLIEEYVLIPIWCN